MIRRLEESSDNVLGWEVTGKVTEEEVRTLSEEFKAAIAEHGKVRLGGGLQAHALREKCRALRHRERQQPL
jgi:hypothetical protein